MKIFEQLHLTLDKKESKISPNCLRQLLFFRKLLTEMPFAVDNNSNYHSTRKESTIMYPKFVLSIITILLFLLTGCEHSKELMPSQVDESTYSSVHQPTYKHGAIARPFPMNLKKDASANQLASNNALGDPWRYPAEEKSWIIMASDTAYYRDVLAGVETYISNATDGETWYADAILPDGSTIKWDNLTFRSSNGDQQNCFISPWWVICGSPNIVIRWYTDVQCRPTGNWTMNFYNNGVKFATKSFYVKPQIAPGKVPSGATYNQGSYATIRYDSICQGPVVAGRKKSVPCIPPYTIPWTIKDRGCYLTAAAMVLTYHGVDVNPLTLNTWLSNNNGYGEYGDVDPDKVAEYATEVRRKNISFRSRIKVRDDMVLEKYVCSYGPQLIGVKIKSNGEPGHWLAATGRDVAKTTFLINDPSGGVTTTVAGKYAGKWRHIRVFSGPEDGYTDHSNISIRFYSPGELLLTDPQGRRIGRDPIKGIDYDEIPNASYAGEGLMDDSDPDADPEGDPSFFMEIDIRQPIDGDYNLNVIGTANGSYSLRVRTMDMNFGGSPKNFRNLSITQNAIHSYSFTYSKSVGSKTNFFGGFDGGGQRPKDVNKFLSYVNPSESQTTLPAGTTTFPFHIFYGNTIIPGTFKAELNGVDISSSFNPAQGGDQVVMLNITSGRNVLVLSVNGQLPTRVATDTDRLVFKVQ